MFAVVAVVLFVIGALGEAKHNWDFLFAGLSFMALSLVLDPLILGRASTWRRQ
jgi:hypothetical protein